MEKITVGLTLASIIQLALSQSHTCSSAINRIKQGPGDFYPFMNSYSAFSDLTFPVGQAIFWSDFKEPDKEYIEPVGLTFNRTRELLHNATLFGPGIKYTDISQGLEGTCYFLSALSSLSQHTQRIKKMFITQQYPDSGLIVIEVFVRGIPTIVTIDDYLPTLGNQFAYTSPYLNAGFWAPFLEKAWAKVNGNYERCDGGWSGEAFKFMTGAANYDYFFGIGFPTEFDDSETLWQIIQKAHEENFPMTIETEYQNVDTEQHNQFNIWYGHVLALLGAFELKDANGIVQHQIYKLRDSFPDNAYNGSWSKQDQRWTDSYKQQVGFSKELDGTFFMDKQDLNRSFVHMAIAHYYDSWFNSYLQVLGDDGRIRTFTFTLQEDQVLYLGIDYYYPRMYAYGCVNQEIMAWGELNLYKNGELILETTIKWEKLDYHMKQLTLSAGRYEVMVKTNWEGYNVKDYTFRINSKEQVDIKEINHASLQHVFLT